MIFIAVSFVLVSFAITNIVGVAEFGATWKPISQSSVNFILLYSVFVLLGYRIFEDD